MNISLNEWAVRDRDARSSKLSCHYLVCSCGRGSQSCVELDMGRAYEFSPLGRRALESVIMASSFGESRFPDPLDAELDPITLFLLGRALFLPSRHDWINSRAGE